MKLVENYNQNTDFDEKKGLDYRKIIIIFICSIIYSIILISFSDLSMWPRKDEINYEQMALGNPVPAPFKHRYLAPMIVGIFPETLHKIVWLSLTILSLALICILIYIYLTKKNYDEKICIFGIMVVMGSQVYQFYLGRWGLVDPLFFVFVMLLLIYFEDNNYIATIVILIIGFLIRPSIIIFLLPILLKSFFNKDKKFLLILSTTLTIFLCVILFRETPGFSMDNLIAELEYHQIYLENGIFNAIIRFFYLVCVNYTLYLYGVIVFCALIQFFKINLKDKFILLFLIGEILFLFTMVTDWYRMMFFLFPFMIELSMGLLNEMVISMKSRKKKVDLEISVVLIIWIIIAPLRWLFQPDILYFGLTYRHYIMIVLSLLGVYLFFIYIREMKRNTEKELKEILFANPSAKLLTK